MNTAQIALPPKLIPVFEGEADVRGAFGGRGSGKTRSFAKMVAVRGYIYGKAGIAGILLCARQFMNSLEDSSLEECKRAIEEEPFLAAYYEVGDKYIKSRDGRVSFAFAGLDRNIGSIKSKGRILLCWVDEAEPVTEGAWQVLTPTLREEGDNWNAELWVTWNPKRKGSATDKRFRHAKDKRTKVVELNWRDNPKFPAKLERERQKDKAERPDSYNHIWEGDYESVVEGAYYASALTQAKEEGRISRVPADPLMSIRLFADIGGTGAKADAFAMWAAQFVGHEIRVLDYYEAQGQPLGAHLAWMRSRGYTPERAQIWLPHDGATHDRVYAVSYESALREAGYAVTVVPNQGRGAAKARIEAARRLFPAMWFSDEATEAGREALGWYHEKRDADRDIGLGPEHDWSSHGCFVGDTEVLTRYGMRQIMNLPDTGEILTPCGWKQYILPRITKRNAPLVEVAFTDGHSVKCTPDHLFMTESGWKSAESLLPNTAILSTLTKSRSISMAVSTGFGQARSICREAASACIGMFGKTRSGLSLKAVTSITETATCSTTIWTTSNASPPLLTSLRVGQSVSNRKMGGSQQQRGTKQPSGMLRQRANFGTSDTLNGRSLGPSGSAKKSHVSTADRSIWRLFAKAAIPASTARRLARSLRIESAATQARVVIESVRPLSETADVWDITVPDGHWFSLANGAVVHNSDAFGLMCVAHEPPTGPRPEPVIYESGGWMG